MHDNKRAEEDVEWTYDRPEGDIVVHAPNAAAALSAIRNHGFLITDPGKLRQTSARKSQRGENIERKGIS